MQASAQDRAAFGAGSYAYMTLLGAVALGWIWLRTARVAQSGLAENTGDPRFYEAKASVARHFMARRLPETGYLRAVVEAGPQTLMAMDAAAFAVTG